MDAFGTTGTLTGVAQQAGLLVDGELPWVERAMLSAALAPALKGARRPPATSRTAAPAGPEMQRGGPFPSRPGRSACAVRNYWTIKVGVRRRRSVPSPSCPASLLPQQYALPSEANPQVELLEAVIVAN